MLSDAQIERYSRQIILPQVGGRWQAALLSATVTVCGRSELATTAGLYLAAAGVGHLRVSPPTAAAIQGVNPDCQVACLASDAAADAVRSAAVVLCAGATAARCVLMHAACDAAGVPVIFADATDTAGWMSVCGSADDPCHRCLRRQLGRMGRGAAPLASVTAGCICTLLATEAIKIMLGMPPSYVGRLLTFDVLGGEVRDDPVMKDPCCAVCARREGSDE